MAQSKIVIKVELNGGQAAEQSKKLKKTNTDLARSYEQVKKATSAANVKIQENKLIAQQANKNAKDLAAQNLRLKQSSNDVGAAFDNQKASAGLNNAILLESSRLASDASYGFQGMANNLGQLVSLFQISSQNSGGFVNVLRDLKSQILGVGGILIAVQLLISFLPQLSKAFANLFKETDDVNESTKELTKTFDELNQKIIDNNEALRKNNEIQKNLISLQEAVSKSNSEDEKTRIGANTIIEINIELLEKLGVTIDKTRIKQEGYIETLIKEHKTSEEIAKSIIDRTTALRVAEITGDISPVEAAQERLDLFVAEKEAINADKEVYLASSEYKILQARLAKAESDAYLQAQKEQLEFQLEAEGMTYKEYLRQREILKKLLESEVEPEPLVMVEGGADDLDAAIRDVEDFLEKYRSKKQEFSKEEEQEAIEAFESLQAQTDGLIDIEEGRLAIQEYYAEKRNNIQDRETRRLERELNKRKRAQEQALNYIASAFNRETAIAKAALVMKEVLAAKSILIDLGVLKSKATKEGLEAGLDVVVAKKDAASGTAKILKTGNPLAVAGYAIFAAAIIGNVIKAVSNTKKAVADAGGSSTGTSSGSVTFDTPDFNIVGASQESQLAQTISTASQNPVRAFVVGKDVTTQQEMDRNITDLATLD